MEKLDITFINQLLICLKQVFSLISDPAQGKEAVFAPMRQCLAICTTLIIQPNHHDVLFTVQPSAESSRRRTERKPFMKNVKNTSAKKPAEDKLRLIAKIFEATEESILITDTCGRITDVNGAFIKITGYSRAEVIGQTPRILQSGHQDTHFYTQMWQQINNTGHWKGEIWNRRKNGEIYSEWISISAIADDDGRITHYVGIAADISLLKQHEKQLERIAHFDSLTNLPNRLLLVERLKQAIAQSRQEKTSLAVCCLDLDGFKMINDTLGHDIGDKVLIELSQRMSRSLRNGDTLARLGGDEFAVLLLALDNMEACVCSLKRLLHVISEPILIEGRPFRVTASLGVTQYPLDNEEPDMLIRHADQAMYIAKQSGKNQYHLFDRNQDMFIKNQHAWRLRIKEGLLADEFELFFQPKVSMHNRQVVGVEALIRWRHPEKGLLLPAEFLAYINNSELEITLGEWVIEAALLQIARWAQQGVTIDVSINITTAHLQTPDFLEKFCRKLSWHTTVQPSQIQIEILESAALADIAAITRIIEAFADFGVRFALDDFGTGYSSLSYLRRLPADTLKIDQSFVRDMLVDEADRAIVEGVIALAHTFNRITVAEGVESLEHFQALQAMGCDLGQGYGIAHPMPGHELLAWRHQFACNA